MTYVDVEAEGFYAALGFSEATGMMWAGRRAGV
jgi:hypothetical protein